MLYNGVGSFNILSIAHDVNFSIIEALNEIYDTKQRRENTR